MILSKEQIKALIEGAYNGEYAPLKLPEWLFEILSAKYIEAAAVGWGNMLGKGAIKDIALEIAMRDNIYYFAAHKTAQELKDLHNLMLGSANKKDYVKKALAVNEKYNKHWYETEYNVTERIAKAGREWRRIEDTQMIYPLLEFVAVNDGNTRESHAAMNGIVKPVGDPFWNEYFPPLDWGCRCRVKRLMEGEQTNTEGMNFPKVEEQFSARVTESRRIWHENHPYFKVDKKTKEKIDEMVDKAKEGAK